MTDHAHHSRVDPQGGPAEGGLHPLVYRTIIGLTIWFVLSIWVLFGYGAYTGLTFAMITVFFVVVVGIPVLISLAWQHNAPASERQTIRETFRAWSTRQFPTRTGAVSGKEAAMQILLPIVAVSIGITIFGLVFHFDVPHPGY